MRSSSAVRSTIRPVPRTCGPQRAGYGFIAHSAPSRIAFIPPQEITTSGFLMSHPEQDSTLEWTIRDLKQLFQQGNEGKEAEAVKSDSFGNGQWRVLFYPSDNSGNGDSISVYLSCEPTEQEKEKAPNGEWQREGCFDFGVELRDANKKTLIKKKEAFNHAFSWKAATWGWSQLVSRDAAYHSLDEIRQQDAFIIVCCVTESKHTS